MTAPPLTRRQILGVWATGVLVALLAGAGIFGIVGIEQSRRQAAEQLALQTQVASVRARLESELNATLSMSLGLSSYVLSRPDLNPASRSRADQEESNPRLDFTHLDQVAASLIRAQPAIRSIVIAPDNVIRYVYPKAGNERVLNLAYLDTPTQRDAVLRLMRERRPIVAGPVELVQGGQGIINRIPVIFTAPEGERYWGLVSVAIDPRPVFARAGLFAPDMQFALRGRDGLGAAGEVFLGDVALFASPTAVRMDIVIPGGRWQLAAEARTASPARGVWRSGLVRDAAVVFAALLVGALATSAVYSHQRTRNLALRDSLTGLANRRQFLLRGEQFVALARRSGRPLALLNLDIDRFKGINDTHGHAVGDQVLAEVGRQLKASFRESDLLARIGGDEFLVLLPDTAADARLDALITRLRAALRIRFPGAASDEPIRLSIGVAALTADTHTLDDLMRNADHSMYEVKRGRGDGQR